MIARLWERVSGSQALPPAWVIGLAALAPPTVLIVIAFAAVAPP